ncbi:hypothetical protein D3C73_780850 [compost metagenome]
MGVEPAACRKIQNNPIPLFPLLLDRLQICADQKNKERGAPGLGRGNQPCCYFLTDPVFAGMNDGSGSTCCICLATCPVGVEEVGSTALLLQIPVQRLHLSRSIPGIDFRYNAVIFHGWQRGPQLGCFVVRFRPVNLHNFSQNLLVAQTVRDHMADIQNQLVFQVGRLDN